MDRFDYIAPTDQSVEKIQNIRGILKIAYEAILEEIPDCRERSLAITNLEQVSMWANKAIVFTQ